MRRPQRGCRWGIQRGQAWFPLRWMAPTAVTGRLNDGLLSGSMARRRRTGEAHQRPNPHLFLCSLVYQPPSSQKSKWTSTRRRRYQHRALSLAAWIHLAKLLNAHWFNLRKVLWEFLNVVFFVLRYTDVEALKNYTSQLLTASTVFSVKRRKVRRVLLNAGAVSWKQREKCVFGNRDLVTVCRLVAQCKQEPMLTRETAYLIRMLHLSNWSPPRCSALS